MYELLLSNPMAFLIAFPGSLAAITVHEFAHAWMADRLGDPTPRYQDRVTLDPRAHLDPLGTIAMLLTGFGWGKPVQFDPYNLKNPTRDTALIALAGPASNLIIAAILGAIIKIGFLSGFFSAVLFYLVFINVMLAIFNFVPVHPLDGSKIIIPLLPRDTALEYEHFMHRYGIIVLFLLIFPWNGGSPVSTLITPIINLIVTLLT